MSNIEKVNPNPNNENEEGKGKDYEILGEKYSNYDLSFKVIIIGNSGKFKKLMIIIYL